MPLGMVFSRFQGLILENMKFISYWITQKEKKNGYYKGNKGKGYGYL